MKESNIENKLEQISKSSKDVFIGIDKDKEPYIKEITKDKVINLTGESGSGKTYFSNKYKEDENYIVIDTDEIFARYENANGINKEIGTMFRNEYDTLPDLYNEFDLIYKEILRYFKETDKIIVIDSAQFRNLKNLNLLKGKVVVMRTCIDTCYKRCINRWEMNHPNSTEEEKNRYINKKQKIYEWYKSLNNFIKKIDDL